MALKVPWQMQNRLQMRWRPRLFSKKSEKGNVSLPRASEWTCFICRSQFSSQSLVVNLNKDLSSKESRFQHLKKHHKLFGFIYSFKHLTKLDLKRHSAVLEWSPTASGNSDIDGYMLADEMDSLKAFLPPDTISESLFLVSSMTWKAQLIFQTLGLPWKSSNNLWHCGLWRKTFLIFEIDQDLHNLRSTMSQERLNGLAVISIKNEVVDQLDFSQLINNYAGAKSWKIFQ